jgi:hypothetical protein
MKKLHILITCALIGTLAGYGCDEKQPEPKPKRSGSPIGHRCVRDADCSSRECKMFKCVSGAKTQGHIGSKCFFDGDCASDECKGFKCVRKGRKK